jgi:integron integrase
MDDKPPTGSPRLLAQVRERLRYLHYSLRTEEAYVYWIRFFVKWSGLRHPKDMGKHDVEAFLSHLANERKVAPSTHRQALSALLFLYKEVLSIELPWMQEIGRPPERKRIPSVLTLPEIQQVLGRLQGVSLLLARLLYGTGMRLQEGLSLRVKDIDFDREVMIVREGKGAKDRVVMLPRTLAGDLRQQLAVSRTLWQTDRAAQRPGVYLPHALEAKYPRAGES